MAKKIAAWMFLLLFPFLGVRATEIVVHNQEEYNKLKKQILTALSKGDKEIDVLFAPGTYHFNDNELVISRIKAPETKIRFIGNGATLIPDGRGYHSGETYVGDFSYDNSWMAGTTDVTIWTQMRYADELIEVVDDKINKCRMKSSAVRTFVAEPGMAYVNVTHWYNSSIYKIEKIEGDYIYFTATDLKRSALKKDGYNVNDDFYFLKTNPRYRLCNVETGEVVLRIKDGKVVLPRGCNVVYEGRGTRFLTVQVSELAGMEFEGFNFVGNKYQDATSYIYFYEVAAKAVCIKNCTFTGLHGNPVSIVKTDNATIEGNTFTDCYYGGVISDNLSSNTRIMNNVFERMGLRRQSTYDIICRGENYYIGNNTFMDYGHGAIGIGSWQHAKQERLSKGLVENNLLTFTPAYLKEMEVNGLMDGGAIYIWTKNDGAVVRNNFINGFSGAGGNKGIFCDDGAYGFSLIGNVVTGIANSFCITSRRVAVVEDAHTPGTDIEASNINNVIRDNVVDGKVMFVGHERKDNGCVMGNTYVLIARGGKMPENTVNNVTVEGGFIPLESTGMKKGRIGVSRTSYNVLKKSPAWKHVKGWFVRKNK